MPRIPTYPTAAALDGTEQMYAVQGGLSVRPTASQLRAFAHRSGGKTWASAGDSITAGGSGGSTTPYAVRAAAYLGLTLTNRGTGGARMCNDGTGVDAYSFVTKAQAGLLNGFDLVTVAYGTNDSGNSLPIGVLDDGNAQTFYGAMGLGYAAIVAASPATRIVFLTPIYRHPSNSAVDPYRAAIRAFCASRLIPCFDAAVELGINAQTQATLLADTLHPADAGAEVFGRYVAGRISSVW